MSTLLDWLNDSLREVDAEVFKDVVTVEAVESQSMSDGQVVIISDIKRLIITLMTSKGERKKVTAIAKLEALSNAGREVAVVCEAFPTEIKMYDDVLKTMKRMMLEVGDQEYLWAECYLTGENKLLFQDLCEEGYKVVPTHHFLDLDHSLLVMKGIGKFHGLSLALKDRSVLDSDLFARPYYTRTHNFLYQMFHSIKVLAQSIKDSWGPEWSSVPERLLKYMEKPGELLCQAWEANNKKWKVLNHGDFTMRNMLFHYNPGSSKPDSIKFVDFQMCHYSNVANDLATLLFSSVRPSIRNKNWKLLLGTYIESLSTSSKLHGYQGDLPTIEDVESSLRTLAPLTIIMFTLSIPMFVTSGKMNLQEKADEFLSKLDSSPQENQHEHMTHFLLSDKDVVDMLQSEIKRCLDENIF